MGSQSPSPVVNEVNVSVDDATEKRCCPEKTKGKVPKRIHKAEREKIKREQLNDLFLELASALDLDEPNNGKASILSEATRLLKDLLGQIEGLKKENASLESESRYVSVETSELKEENSVLETQIEELQSKVKARVMQSKPDLNAPPPEFQQSEMAAQFADTTVPQAPAVFAVPIHPDIQAFPMTTSNVSKPHARYPTPADSWPSQLLKQQITSATRNKQ